MSIEAHCPNGHRIHCPDESLGRAARCPKCAAPFRIGVPQPGAATGSGTNAAASLPEAATATAEPEADAGAATEISASVPADVEQGSTVSAESSETPPETLAETPASGSRIGGESKITGNGSSKQLPATAQLNPNNIVFLCPNGHRLNGPSKLAGRLGQCPHCHTKFQIPPLEVIRAAQAGESGNLAGLEDVQFAETDFEEAHAQVEDTAASHEDPNEIERMLTQLHVEQQSAVRPASGVNILGSAINKVTNKLTGGVGSQIHGPSYQQGPTQPVAAIRPAETSVHPLADLVMRLWAEREHGGIIELHLEGGNVLLPDWFERGLSTKSHGLFASQAADGTVTMTVVPWDNVERVVIRGVVGIPDGMFE